jgi:hypothetical protein
MTQTLRSLSALGAGILAAGILTALAPVASAQHDVYPPGWDKPQNVPKPMYDFRSGKGWDDYQRYWPGEVTRGTSVQSHPMTYGSTTYQMVPGGSQYHRVTGATTQGASTQPAPSSQSSGTKQTQ